MLIKNSTGGADYMHRGTRRLALTGIRGSGFLADIRESAALRRLPAFAQEHKRNVEKDFTVPQQKRL
jgi:hypothetical protein